MNSANNLSYRNCTESSAHENTLCKWAIILPLLRIFVYLWKNAIIYQMDQKSLPDLLIYNVSAVAKAARSANTLIISINVHTVEQRWENLQR